MKKSWYLILLLAVALLGVLEWSYGLSYVHRVFTKQDSDVDDINWKPVLTLNRSPNPRYLKKQLKPDQVIAAFELHPAINDLNSFMEEFGSTSLVVVQNGVVIYEAHYNGHVPGQAVASFSVSKSAVSMVLGRMLAGELSGFMEGSVAQYVPELIDRDSRFENISHSDLINMRSGIAIKREVSFPYFTEDLPLLYYSDSVRKVVLNRAEIESAPGEFVYNDFNPGLLGLAFERASGRSLPELLQSELWNPMGATNDAVWMTDYEGVPLMAAGLGAAPIDLALMGQTMLEVGAGLSDVIMQRWHTSSTSISSEKPANSDAEPAWYYENGWWVMPREAGAPDYSAIGHLGQYVYVSPQSDLVIVRTGMHKGDWSDEDFIQLFYDVASGRL